MDSVTVGSTAVNASDGRFGFVASREDCLLPGCVPRGLSSAPSELASAQRVRSSSLSSRATTNYARARGQVCCDVGFRRDSSGSGSSSRHHQFTTPDLPVGSSSVIP